MSTTSLSRVHRQARKQNILIMLHASLSMAAFLANQGVICRKLGTCYMRQKEKKEHVYILAAAFNKLDVAGKSTSKGRT